MYFCSINSCCTGESIFSKNSSIGKIDYASGIVHIKGLRITNLLDPNFYFIFKTSSFDVVSVRNQIVDIPLNRLNVTVIQDQTNNAGLISGYNYKFTNDVTLGVSLLATPAVSSAGFLDGAKVVVNMLW